MNSFLRQAVEQVDRLVAWFSLTFIGETSSLLIPMFHGVYPDRASTLSASFDRQQGITLAQFRTFVASFATAGVKYIRPEDLDNGLEEGHQYMMLTFDDGYFNNVSVLPILEEFNAPAVFFVSANHVLQGKAFWWDVLYRESKLSKRPMAELHAVRLRCKAMSTDKAEDLIKQQFKLQALLPTSDLDRPMTPAELKSFSRSRFVVIGNHTLDHAILTNYSAAGIREQIEGGQEALHSLTGVRPSCIAYPNGNCSTPIVEAAMGAGLTSGVVAFPGRNIIPISPNEHAKMKLMRVVPSGDRDIESQCKVFRSRYSLYRTLAHARSLRSAQAYEGL